MSVAAPKSQAKEPINLDILLVCRKAEEDRRPKQGLADSTWRAEATVKDHVSRFNATGRWLSRNDVRVMLFSRLLVELSPSRDACEIGAALKALLPYSKEAVERIWATQTICREPQESPPQGRSQQRRLFR